MAIKLPKREFYEARISSGTYNTKGYYSKIYKTAAGLKRGLVAHNFKSGEAYNGMTWNHYSTQYKLSFNWD